MLISPLPHPHTHTSIHVLLHIYIRELLRDFELLKPGEGNSTRVQIKFSSHYIIIHNSTTTKMYIHTHIYISLYVFYIWFKKKCDSIRRVISEAHTALVKWKQNWIPIGTSRWRQSGSVDSRLGRVYIHLHMYICTIQYRGSKSRAASATRSRI